jgi:hypothetical protein
MAEVFSDETSTTSAAAKRCAQHTQRKNELTPLHSPQARHQFGKFGVLLVWGSIWPQLYTSCLTTPAATKWNISHKEMLQQKNTRLSMCPGNVYPVHEHDKQWRKPTRTPSPRPRPRPRPREKKKSKFVNEVMPFLKSRSSSPRFRMESTKGKMNMHFETISNDHTSNADLRMPTVNTHWPIIHWKLTAQFEKIAIANTCTTQHP